MKRDLYNELVSWKHSAGRKPLLLRGARQTGKTYLLQEFGKNEYEQMVYLNFEELPLLAEFFKRDLDPARILRELGLYLNYAIKPNSDLIVFDEVQASNQALNSLKYFNEQANDYHIAAAGSLLGIKMSTPGSFPVGKVNFLDLYPMTFLEFLDAMGGNRYRQLLESLEKPLPISPAFHAELVDLLRKYYFVGGMPEAIKQFRDTSNAGQVRKIQQEIIDSYVLDFAKHAPASDIPKLSMIWNSIPKQLAKENKKFVFSAVRPGARSREYENALQWLDDAGLIHRCYAVTRSKLPLEHYADPSCFKVYSLDVGLLGAMAKSPAKRMVEGERLFNEYEGAFTENYVAQQLVGSSSGKALYYWRSRGGKAELDFLCDFHENIIPLEVKAGINTKSKSLRSFDEQFSPQELYRVSLLNIKKDGKICNLPLYAVSRLGCFHPRFRKLHDD